MVILFNRRSITEPVGPPWAMARYELHHFKQVGLQEVSFEAFDACGEAIMRKLQDFVSSINDKLCDLDLEKAFAIL